ncbi:MAG: acetate--CoA ligase family protein [Nitratireductor sp.]|nr:acetate--CoA ligase family protein [Nitratireductor sp.]
MSGRLSRLLRPKSVALFGGGWAGNVIAQLQKSGFDGDIWPVNPKRADILGIPCYASIEDLPAAPDASFVGVNREASIEVIRQLRDMGAGGATCFASGFSESEAEGTGGADLQRALVEAAGDMPILGPNCYGMLNYLDNVTLWPDQHGGLPVKTGVAIIAQSSNIAINMTMQARVLPIAYVVAAGNQAQTGVAEIAEALLTDERVTAIGLYLEGFGDIRALEGFAARAAAKGKPVVALKIGRSEKAQAATMTHTASLAGGAATSSALLARLGFVETTSIGVFLETLKLMHAFGPLPGNAVCSVSCSGGEASLMADLAEGSAIDYRDFSSAQVRALKDELGPIVSIANPLDYHTFIWGDTERMTRVFSAVLADGFDLTVFVLDLPRADRCDPSSYQCAVDAIIAAQAATGARTSVLTSLPENLSEPVSAAFLEAGILPLHGMEEGLLAIDAAIRAGRRSFLPGPVLLSAPKEGGGKQDGSIVLSEAQSKAELARHGLPLAKSATANSIDYLASVCEGLSFPLVLKGIGIAHKSEAGAVALNLRDVDAVIAAARGMQGVNGFLVEEMIGGGLAEILVGVTRDATGLYLLTVGSGGIMTELMEDAASLLLPVSREDIGEALSRLKVARLLEGFRGRPAADMTAVLDAIEAVCHYAEANAGRLIELDVNPLIACKEGAFAVDALIRLEQE